MKKEKKSRYLVARYLCAILGPPYLSPVLCTPLSHSDYPPYTARQQLSKRRM